MSHRHKAFDAALRSDFHAFLHKCVISLNLATTFQDNWHISAIAHELGRIIAGDNTRLIINLPPRHLKSTIVTVAFPAYLLGLHPERRIVTLSYGSDLALKHAADFRAIVESQWYQRAFPKMRIARATDAEIHTTARGYRKTTSVSATLTGYGGDLFIIDDPQKPVDAQSALLRDQLNKWFSSTLISRLDDKQTSAIIVVMQRVHLGDLTGHLIENSNVWTTLSLPAIAESREDVPLGHGLFHRREIGEALHPGRESLATLQQLRATMTPDDFAAQYQQTPVPPGGGMIKREWLRWYDEPPDRMRATKILMSVDTASKLGPQNDWTVCTVWYVVEKKYFLIDLVRGRFEYPLLRSTVVALAEAHRTTAVLIEDASIGTALGQELQQEHFLNNRLVTVRGTKADRLYVQQAKFSTGQVLFPRNAPYRTQLEYELLTFPQGRTDDIVD